MSMMNDTRMSDAWIKRAVEDNPIVLLESGNYRTCPVRLSFVNLFKRGKPVEVGQEGKYGANLLFPVDTNLSILKSAAAQAAKDKWGDKPPKLRSPFKDQGESLKWGGYTEGGIYLACNSTQKPTVVDTHQQIITDEARAYPGVWAICTIRPFTYDQKVNRGVAFGLQSVMIVADDESLGGGSEDISKAFANVKIDAGDVDADALFS